MERIGFIGAGHIGSNMVLRLMDKGRKVRVCDINDAVRRRFADEGAETTGEARDLAVAARSSRWSPMTGSSTRCCSGRAGWRRRWRRRQQVRSSS